MDIDGYEIAANALRLGGTMIIERDSEPPRAATITFDEQRFSFVTGHPSQKVNGAAPVRPTITSITYSSPPSGDTFYLGETMTVTVAFDTAVTVLTMVSDPPTSTGTPYLSMNCGRLISNPSAPPCHATYQRAPDDRTLVFTFAVHPEDGPEFYVFVQNGGFKLDGAEIVDAADGTTPAIVGFTQAEHRIPFWRFDGSRPRHPPEEPEEEADAIPPAIIGATITSTPAQGDTYGVGETIAVAVTFDEPVTVTGAPVITLTVGAETRAAAYTDGSGTATLMFTYRVAADDRDDDGVSVAAAAVAGGAIRDQADNDTTLALLALPALPDDPAHRVDGVAPMVAAITITSTPAQGDTSWVGETIAVAVTFDEPVTVTGQPRLVLTVGPARGAS